MDLCRREKASLPGTGVVLSSEAWEPEKKLPIQTKTKQSIAHPTCLIKLEMFYIISKSYFYNIKPKFQVLVINVSVLTSKHNVLRRHFA